MRYLHSIFMVVCHGLSRVFIECTILHSWCPIPTDYCWEQPTNSVSVVHLSLTSHQSRFSASTRLCPHHLCCAWTLSSIIRSPVHIKHHFFMIPMMWKFPTKNMVSYWGCLVWTGDGISSRMFAILTTPSHVLCKGRQNPACGAPPSAGTLRRGSRGTLRAYHNLLKIIYVYIWFIWHLRTAGDKFFFAPG